VSPVAARVRPVPVVRGLPFLGDDEQLLAAVRAGEAHATAELVARYSRHVLRVLARILGRTSELEDLHHDVFVRALSSIGAVRDASAMSGWLTIIAVNVARSAMAKRARSRWLWFLPPDEVPEQAAHVVADEDVAALRATYRVLGRLGAEERIVFALRIIDGMEMADVASACGVSLATAKRRMIRAERAFLRHAEREAVLEPWLKGGARWGRS
jgi:RNA polymerase sigma-70 factor, ECF subfamily